MSRCKERPDSFQPGKRVQGHASMMIYTNDSASDRLQLILSKMVVDDVSTCVKKDQLIIQFGNKLCTRLRKDGNQQHYISNKLRELGRLTLETQRCCIDVMSLQEFLIPKNFGFVVEAATELSDWNEEDGTLSAPSIGIKLGHSLKKCGKILEGNAIRGGNRSLAKQADDFDELMRLSWDDEINRVARKELQIRKFNKPLILPLTSDLQALRKHLKFSISSATNAVANDNENKEEYRKLATATLCSLILFNRRRSGEPSLIKVKEYDQNLTSTVIHGEVKESLSPFELELCKAFKRLEIREKKGRKVPLLITREVENAMNLLIKLRGGVLTNPENSYLFCVLGNGSLKNVRGPDAMKKHVRLCGALKNPETIYSTNLRKHVATLSQLLNLEKRELEMLANFMGHYLSIHREFYRLPEDTLQLAKCGKLMMLMETGGVGKQHGKSLSEIEVNLEDVIDESSGIAEQEASNKALGSDAIQIEKSTCCEEDSSNKSAHGRKKSKSTSSETSSEDEVSLKTKHKKVVRKKKMRTWTDQEKDAVRQHLGKFLKLGTVHRQNDILPALQNEHLKHRTWLDVKNWIHNNNKRRKSVKKT